MNIVKKAKKFKENVEKELLKREVYFDSKNKKWAFSNKGEVYNSHNALLRDLIDFLDDNMEDFTDENFIY
jgi:hypothetical protein